jgi:hypothetical protein
MAIDGKEHEVDKLSDTTCQQFVALGALDEIRHTQSA